MTLTQLQALIRVAEMGGFSQAARAFDIAQPALSRQVRQLETDLRETLLVRNGRGVSLTPAGERLLVHARRIVAEVDAARQAVGAQRDTPGGQLTVALPPSLARRLTRPLVEHFRDHLPGARLSLVEGLSGHVGEWVASGRVDLALVYQPEADAAIEIEPLRHEALGLVGLRSAGQGEALGPSIRLADLAGRPLVLPERHHAMRRLLQSQALLAGVRLDIAWEVSSVPSLIDLVCAGLGEAVLNESAVRASGQAHRLRLRPIVEPELHSVLCLALPATRPPTALGRAVRAWMRGAVNAGHAEKA